MKKNSIEIIKYFMLDQKGKNLIINKVTDEIGIFYDLIISQISYDLDIKLIRELDNNNIDESDDLFGQKKIHILSILNSKIIEKTLERNFPKIIITDYKNFKKISKNYEVINGYDFEKDLKYYLTSYLNIENENITNYCLSQPHLTNSETTKYKINPKNYTKDPIAYEAANNILQIRKSILKSKKINAGIKKLFLLLKKEVIYKRFSFLVF
tara:strand:- start:404 stop:1036 length:633 start_codon:yes stop_codon:yes gene_type:complete